MRCGVTLPNLGVAGAPATLVELAVAAERAGWDGVFFWDTFGGPEYDTRFPADRLRRAPWDPWVVMTAVAAATTRVRLGTIVTPVSRRRPWKLAAESATLDRLSGGRVNLAVSLGWTPDAAFAGTGEVTDRAVRARRLDEGLAVLTALWAEERVTLHGEHFHLDDVPGIPPVQQPRIPIWVVGAWPSEPSMRRALRFDGLLPAIHGEHGWLQPSADELPKVVETVRAARGPDAFEVVVEGHTSRDPGRAVEKVEPYRTAGATWWLEGVWGFLDDPPTATERMRARIDAGPPAVDVR